MKAFYETLDNITELLRREKRVSYRAIQREFEIDEKLFSDLKSELVEVKRVAREAEGQVLEWIGPVAADRPSQQQRAKRNQGAQQEPRQKSKRTLLIWLGAAVIIIGVFLPWATVWQETQLTGQQAHTVNGFNINQGGITLGIAIINAILGFLTANRTVPARLISGIIILTGIAVIGMAIDVMIKIGDARLEDLGIFTGMIRAGARIEPGVVVAMVGGALLSLGGVIATFRTRTRRDN